MPLSIKNALKYKDQDFIRPWIQQRFLNDSNFQGLSGKPPLRLKNTKPISQWNSYPQLSNDMRRNYYWVANFHHLTGNINCYVGNVTNVNIRNYARGRQKPPDFDTHLGGIRELYVKERLDKEMARLRKKGMKDLKVKIPDWIICEKKT